jgi:hypothetical protein
MPAFGNLKNDLAKEMKETPEERNIFNSKRCGT